jgi:glycosyltransferase involved in cell wall biosynthesis
MNVVVLELNCYLNQCAFRSHFVHRRHMSRLRIVILGPSCNPETISMPYVTYSHAAAHAELHEVTFVVGADTEEKVRRAGAPFHAIEVIRMPWLERLHAWAIRRVFKYNFDTQTRTAFNYPFALAFEWRAWRQLRRRIKAGEFDAVLRVMPMSPVMPSPFAFFLRKGPIPFVLGPLNGGLPWPEGFSQLQHQKEWISNLRNVYRVLPFARSTYRNASAIIAASSQTFSEFAKYSDKLFFVPEPGIARSLCCEDTRASDPSAKLKLLFVGGLVPRKACDIALRAAAPLLAKGLAHFTVIGDGPDRPGLQELAKTLGVQESVDFHGWLDHSEVLKHMRSADVFLFPTLRDNGAGVVFEALASGAVPVVVDFGGPGDIVYSEVGCKVPLTNEGDVVTKIENVLMELAQDRPHLERLRKRGMIYAREQLTWDAKANQTTQVLEWVARRSSRPNLPPPKLLTEAAN